MPASSFSSVLLPAPLWPMMPSALALLHVQVDVFQGLDLQHVLLAAAKEAVEHVVLEALAALTTHVELQAHVVEFDQLHQSALARRIL